MKRVAVIGGGISGLSAAFNLEKKRCLGAPIEYVIFERGERFGGVIKTEEEDGCVIEGGPDSFLTEKPWAAELCRELGLQDQLIGSNDGSRVTYMLVNGRLVPIPDGLMFMVPTNFPATLLSPLFSWHTKLRIVREWFYRSEGTDSDVTVAEFVERHYGREMVDRVADPLLAGVYGGGADELSARSVLARFVEMEGKHGSLGKALIQTRRSNSARVPAKPIFTSVKNGMQQMVDALLRQLPQESLHSNVAVNSVRAESGKWVVTSRGRTQEFDAVIVATPAYSTAELIASIPELAQELRCIAYSSSVTAVLGFEESIRKSLPPGFGFLVPRKENRRILAATFVHNKFPHRAPPNRALIRCFLGGSGNESILQCSDAETCTLVSSELRTILGVTAAPVFSRIYRWPKSMAQYVPGHSERLIRMQRVLAECRGLALAGNAYSGIGVPDCVRSGAEAAAKVLRELAL